jgi:hypothetical protein
MNARLFRYLLLPARPAGLMLIAVLTLGVAFSGAAGTLGLPLLLVLAGALCMYGYILLEHVAHGAHEPPVLALEMLNPVSEHRPLLQLLIIGAVWLAIHALSAHIGALATTLLEGLALIALPACVAVLAIADNFWQAINPLALWHVVRALGSSYLMIVGVALLAAFGLAALAGTGILASWTLYALGIYAWLALFALIGGALFEHRSGLGLQAMHAPERLAQRLQTQLDAERQRFVDGLFGQARGGNLRGAWQSIEARLEAEQQQNDAYEWLLANLARHEDQRLADRLAQVYIHRLLGHNNGRVVELALERLGRDTTFHPRTQAETLRVADLLRLAGQRGSAEAMLASVERDARAADISGAVGRIPRADAPPTDVV